MPVCRGVARERLQLHSPFTRDRLIHVSLFPTLGVGLLLNSTLLLIPQAPAKYHRRSLCQNKKLYHNCLQSITATRFANQGKNLTTSTCEVSPPRIWPRQKPYHKHLQRSPPRVLRRHLTTSTCEESPPRLLPRQKPYHKHLRRITTPRCAKTKKTLPRAPAKYHRHAPRVVPRQKPYHKHLRSITATRFAKATTLAQAPAKYLRHALRQDKTLPQAPWIYNCHAFCQGKSLTTMTCEASPPLARTKPYLPQAPAKYHYHAFCQT